MKIITLFILISITSILISSCNDNEESTHQNKVHTNTQPIEWPASINFSDKDSTFSVHISRAFGNIRFSNPEQISTVLGNARYEVFANESSKQLKLFISKSMYNPQSISNRPKSEILEMSANAFIHDLHGRTSLTMPIVKKDSSFIYNGLRVFYVFPIQDKDSLFGCSELFIVGSTVFHTCIITEQKQLFSTSKDIGLIFTSFMPKH